MDERRRKTFLKYEFLSACLGSLILLIFLSIFFLSLHQICKPVFSKSSYNQHKFYDEKFCFVLCKNIINAYWIFTDSEFFQCIFWTNSDVVDYIYRLIFGNTTIQNSIKSAFIYLFNPSRLKVKNINSCQKQISTY